MIAYTALTSTIEQAYREIYDSSLIPQLFSHGNSLPRMEGSTIEQVGNSMVTNISSGKGALAIAETMIDENRNLDRWHKYARSSENSLRVLADTEFKKQSK